jgi:uncharacterized membrane protein
LSELIDQVLISGEGIESVGRVEIMLAQYRELFVGPLPHPRILAQYKEIDPTIPDRVITMAEKQIDHRINLESAVVSGDVKRSDRGLVFAFILSGIVVLGSILLIYMDKPIEAFALVVLNLATLAGVFIYNSRRRERERIRKAKVMAGQEEPQPAESPNKQ